MASSGRKSVLTITPAEAEALLPHLHQACLTLRCVASMHAAARLTSQAKGARLAARRLAAFQARLHPLASRATVAEGALGKEASPAAAPEGTLLM